MDQFQAYQDHQFFKAMSPEVISQLKDDFSFSHWSLKWLTLYKLDIVKNNTFLGTYEEPLRLYLLPYFGRSDIRKIKSSDIQRYFKQLISTLSLETLKKHRNCLSGIFALAIDDGIIQTNPVTARLVLKSNVRPIEKRVWTAEQYQQVWNFAKTHPYGLDILVLMETAITRSELLGLTWRDYRPRQGVLLIRNGLVSARNPHNGQNELLHDGVKNCHRERTIPISKELNAYLSLKPRKIYTRKQWIAPEYIFHSPKGLPYNPDNWYKRILLGFMRDLCETYPNIPILTTHELRHTRASLLVNSGVNIFAVAELMGHADLKMLRHRYAHADVESVRAALEQTNQLLSLPNEGKLAGEFSYITG